MPFGTAITMLVSGYITHYFGWVFVFYVTGVVTVIWFGFWAHFVRDSPAQDPRISHDELKYIESQIGLQGTSVCET
jgi:MFS family permease